jgi:hypothetical protein
MSWAVEIGESRSFLSSSAEDLHKVLELEARTIGR